jgi:hypothetical protein
MLEQVLMWKDTMLSHNVSFHINTCSNILLHKLELAKNVPVFFSLAYKLMLSLPAQVYEAGC